MRYYSSQVGEKKIDTTALTSSANQVKLDNLTNMPSYPCTFVIEPDTANEEIVTVTGFVSGTTVAITRGQDGSSAVSHPVGAVVKHMVTARDLQEPQDHMNTGINVHGVGSGNSVVGTGTAQTLTNKTIPFGGASGNSITNLPQSSVDGLTAALAAKAALASPTFTGTPLSTTPDVTDDSTRIATTAFVQDVADTKVDEPTSNGIVVRNAAGTSVARTLVEGSGISITNPDGVSGNITIASTVPVVQKGSTSVTYSSGTGSATVTSATTTASSIIVATSSDSQVFASITSVGTNTFTISVRHVGSAGGSVTVRWMVV